MLLKFGKAFMILVTKIALPTVDVQKDILIIQRVLSLPAHDTFEHYAGLERFRDPRYRDKWHEHEILLKQNQRNEIQNSLKNDRE